MPNLKAQLEKFSNIQPEELLETLNITDAPVNVDSIAEQLGIDVQSNFSWSKSYSGEITFDNDNVSVWINPLDNERRQNFTLAHEIGHLINDIIPSLGKGNGQQVSYFRDTPETLRNVVTNKSVETRANQFAARLLMPVFLIEQEGIKCLAELERQFGENNVDPEIFTKSMAERFNVSKVAMEIRLKNLGIL